MFSYFRFQQELKLKGRTRTFELFLKYRKRRYPGVGWADHVRTWLAAPNVDILWIKYEDLQLQPAKEMARIVHFLKVDASEAAIAWSIKAASRETMQKTEAETGAGIFSTKYKRRKSSFRMVHGKTHNSWKDQFAKSYFRDNENEQLFARDGYYMSKCLGYENK